MIKLVTKMVTVALTVFASISIITSSAFAQGKSTWEAIKDRGSSKSWCNTGTTMVLQRPCGE